METELARCPDWYQHLQAAKYLEVPPWELAEQSIYWRDKAIIAMNVESDAAAQLRKRNAPSNTL